MRITVLLSLLLLVGVVNGSPVQELKYPEMELAPKELKHPEMELAPKSRVIKRSYQATNGLICCRLQVCCGKLYLQ